MNATLKYFVEGFTGSLKLAAAIVMAVVAVSSSFVHGGFDHPIKRHDGATRL